MLMKLFFSPPSNGANKLYEGALGEHRSKTGVFLVKGRVAELKFQDQAWNVLQRVHAIYEHDFLLHR
ncbi:hypothetical protein D3C75_964500 [compost metagenome]